MPIQVVREDKVTNKIIRNYGYVDRHSANRRFHITKGQLIAGYTVGIMHLDVHYPLVPGNVVNATTFDFPVRYQLIPGADGERVHTGDRSLLPALIETARKLEMEGVRAICGACGYLGHFQQEVANEIDIPVYLSSLVQGTWIEAGLKRSQKIGVLCADHDADLTASLLTPCGIDNHDRYIIRSAGDLPEFNGIATSKGHFNHQLVEEEIVGLARQMVEEDPDIGAILLECSDMPPYSAAIQAELNIPVFDFNTLIRFVHSVVAQKPYYGFM
ncbi:aspartate/glutamate racemase family protein [Rhodobacteraceae bacterium RKSG542]|uniref:aspartate/glutamate racemase family protein n=1 Tax=Pseudovibrio flavus TaxID=2529854 RepID=UPI0012BCB828|nr:aspartate/glutamate racemase family protein [Pseudovibrio flavus]MTI17750.1 aspartate/glutamate racemase family protein [Pseudovibrio flavus]